MLDERAVDEENLRAALRDLNRLSQAYGEYLSWSRALGSFLAAPLGPVSQRRDNNLQIRWGLPLSTAIGHAAPAEADLATAVGYLRRDLFNIGWLSGAWEQLVVEALPPPPGSRDITADNSPMWAQPGRGSGSVLDEWSTALFSGSVTATGADVTWRRALQSLTGSMTELVDTLINRVHDPQRTTAATEEFLCGIHLPAPPPRTEAFDPAMLTDFAITTGLAGITDDVRKQIKSGVGTVCVATQFSDAIPVDYILTAPPGTSSPEEWSHSVPAAPREGTTARLDPDRSPPGRHHHSPPEPGGGHRF